MRRSMTTLLGLLAPLAWSAASLAAGGEEAGEPKAELIGWDPTTAIWVIVIFLIMLAILYPTAWKGVLAGLKAREERIRKDIADAEATRAKAQATLQEYNQQLATAEEKVRELLGKAQADGERLAATIRENATKEAEGIKSKAMGDIEQAGKTAVAKIHEEAADLATSISEKIIRKNLNVEDQRELVRSSLQQLDSTRTGRN